MQVSFDLISDLHVETWPEPFDWTGMATSVIAVVAGDISRDRELVVQTLEHLSECYKAVIFVDGNDEHRWTLDDLEGSYDSLKASIQHIPNLIFLQNNVVVIDGVGFVGSNTWWTYDFDNTESYESTKQWFADRYKVSLEIANNIESCAFTDINYLVKSMKKLQTHQDIKQLVVITHTVPTVELIQHDIDLEGTHMLNCSGNSHLMKTFVEDTEGKIHTWCFGHYHGDVDTVLHGVRFVNNCRGRGDTAWCKKVYHPKRITVDL